jgi:hypothetical protein
VLGLAFIYKSRRRKNIRSEKIIYNEQLTINNFGRAETNHINQYLLCPIVFIVQTSFAFCV